MLSMQVNSLFFLSFFLGQTFAEVIAKALIRGVGCSFLVISGMEDSYPIFFSSYNMRAQVTEK
jgi:hypothetical protein